MAVEGWAELMISSPKAKRRALGAVALAVLAVGAIGMIRLMRQVSALQEAVGDATPSGARTMRRASTRRANPLYSRRASHAGMRQSMA